LPCWATSVTIDASVWIDYRDAKGDRHPLALALFALAQRGKVELWVAPQGYRLDLTRGDTAEQLREAFERKEVRQARQVALRLRRDLSRPSPDPRALR
jgi:predicted nucleic acid-binding protein